MPNRRYSRESGLVLILSLVFTVLAWNATANQMRHGAEARFNAESRLVVSDISESLDDYDKVLISIAALIEINPQIDRRVWRDYMEKLRLQDSLPGLVGVGFAKRVEASQMPEFLASVRAEGFPDFVVSPPGERPVSFPVEFLEPFSGRNLRAFGFDIYSDPVRRATMDAAAEGADARVTPKIQLIQDDRRDPNPGFMMVQPVYGTPRPPLDPAARKDALRGFVYSSVRMAPLISAVLKHGKVNDLDLIIYSGPEANPSTLMVSTSPQDPTPPPARFRHRVTVEIGGTPWTIETATNIAFDSNGPTAMPWVVLAAGLVVSLLLAVTVDALVNSRERALLLANANIALEQARAEADGANQAKSRFLAAASHDLRQPLQSLGLYLHLLTAQLESENQRMLALHAMDGFEATQRLLTSLMDISSLDSGMIRPDVKPVRLDEVVTMIAQEMHPEADAKGLGLRVRVPKMATVETDAVLLERMFRNLVSNALRYTQKGGVLLALRDKGSFYCFEVWDTGMGIPEDKVQLIFEDFYQLANPRRDRDKGMGLGLATVARLARLLGFRVRVRSRLGRGSVFRVELPKSAHPLSPGAA